MNIHLLALVTPTRAARSIAAYQDLRIAVSFELPSTWAYHIVDMPVAGKAQGGIISSYLSTSCNCQPCSFIVGFGNPDSQGVKYCDAYTDRHNICIPDDNIYKGQNPDIQPPADSKKRSSASKPPGGLYMTKRGMKVVFAEDLEPGTPIKHARARRARSETRQATCDTGDGDEWDDGADGLRIRSSTVRTLDMPEHEIIDDVIAYKME